MRHLTLLLVFSALPVFAAFPDICVRCWYEVPGSNLSAVYQTPTPPGNTGSASVMKAWNGGAFDARRNRLIVTGGGVTDYAGNEVYAFDVDSLRWYRIKNGSSAYDEDDTLYAYYRNGGSQPDSQQPRPGSNYDQMEYDSLSDNLYIFGAPFAYKHSTMWKNIFQLNLGTLAWSRPGQVTSNIDFGGSLSARDPATGKIWIFGNGNGAWMSSFHPGTGVLTDHGDYWTGADIPSCQTAAVMPPRNRVVSVGAGSAQYWNIVTSGNTYTQTLSTTGCDSLQAAYAPGFEWSPVDGKMVGWVKGSHVVTMDTSYTCSDVAPDGSNTVTPDAPQANGTYGRWRYVPKYNVFVLVNSTTGSVYFYRHSADPNAVPPSIATHPTAQTVNEEQTATFSVTATGNGTLVYQWQKNGGNISGATSASYTTPATVPADSGAVFRCIVSNAGGADTSDGAALSVRKKPVITGEPAADTVDAGQTASFSVTATGFTPLSYRWQRGGADISGATSATYNLASTTLSDNGAVFRCIVSNVAGADTSADAALTVHSAVPAVAITSPQADQYFHTTQIDVEWYVDGVLQTTQTTENLTADGEHLVIRTATGGGGTGRDTVRVFRDTAPPVVLITAPTEGKGFNVSPITVAWSVDGVPQNTQTGQNLTEGTNRIVRIGTDQAGNTDSAVVNVFLDIAPPTVEITFPAPGAIIHDAVTAVEWKVDGVTREIQLTQELEPGENLIIRGAVDSLGNTAYDTVHVTYSLDAPVVQILSPTQGQTLLSSPVTVDWTVDGVHQTSFTTEDLEEGVRTITRQATFNGGTQSESASIQVYLDSQPEACLPP